MHPIHIFCLLNYLTNSPSSAINCSIADDGGVELDYGSDDKDEGQTLNFSEIFDENLSSNEESNIVFASEISSPLNTVFASETISTSQQIINSQPCLPTQKKS